MVDPSPRSWIIGVQWHAETLAHLERHARLFEALVGAAASAARRRLRLVG